MIYFRPKIKINLFLAKKKKLKARAKHNARNKISFKKNLGVRNTNHPRTARHHQEALSLLSVRSDPQVAEMDHHQS